MHKARYSLFVIALLMAVIGSACASAQPTSAPPAAQPPAAQPVEPPPAAPPADGQTAPLCQTGATSCTVPDVTDTEATDTYCVEKIPYQNILVPDGTTWEVLDTSGDFTCTDQATFVDGKRVIACSGKELFAFQLKLTNPACGGGNLATGTGQCQEGFGFDAAQQCCAPVGAGDAGSVTITVNMGACPLPQQP